MTFVIFNMLYLGMCAVNRILLNFYLLATLALTASFSAQGTNIENEDEFKKKNIILKTPEESITESLTFIGKFLEDLKEKFKELPKNIVYNILNLQYNDDKNPLYQNVHFKDDPKTYRLHLDILEGNISVSTALPINTISMKEESQSLNQNVSKEEQDIQELDPSLLKNILCTDDFNEISLEIPQISKESQQKVIKYIQTCMKDLDPARKIFTLRSADCWNFVLYLRRLATENHKDALEFIDLLITRGVTDIETHYTFLQDIFNLTEVEKKEALKHSAVQKGNFLYIDEAKQKTIIQCVQAFLSQNADIGSDQIWVVFNLSKALGALDKETHKEFTDFLLSLTKNVQFINISSSDPMYKLVEIYKKKELKSVVEKWQNYIKEKMIFKTINGKDIKVICDELYSFISNSKLGDKKN
jgi:hypothetical protein